MATMLNCWAWPRPLSRPWPKAGAQRPCPCTQPILEPCPKDLPVISTTAIACLLIAGLMPLLATAVAKWGFAHYDNHNPRQWLAQQSGARARANAAQANAFEAFPFFAVGVIVASLVQVDAGRIQALSAVFVLARLAYIYCYITDKASLRSVVWGVAMACSVALYGSALAL